MLGADRVREPFERLEHLLGLGLARDDPPVDSTTQRSATTLGALPPWMIAAFTVGRPTSGCSRSGRTSSIRRRNRAIEVIALTPKLRRGAVRRRAASGGGDPRAAPLGEGEVQFVGSPTMAASWSR